MIKFRPSLVLLFNSVNKDSYTYYRKSRSLPLFISVSDFVIDFSVGHSFFYHFKLLLLFFGIMLAKFHLFDFVVTPHYRFRFSSLIPRSYKSRTVLLDDGLDSFRIIPSNIDSELIFSCKYFVPSSIISSLSFEIPSWLSSSKRYSRVNYSLPPLGASCFPDMFYSYSSCIIETRSIDISLELYAKSLGTIPCSSETIVIKHPNPSKMSRVLDARYKRISYPLSHIPVQDLPFRHLIFGSSVLPLSLISYFCREANKHGSPSFSLTITFLLERQCLSAFNLLLSISPASMLTRDIIQNDEYILVQSTLNI